MKATNIMSFNLDTLALNDTAILHLKHPATDELLYADGDAKKEPVTITLRGTASKEYRQALAKMQNRHLNRGKTKQSAEAFNEESIAILLACSVSAQNFQYKGTTIQGEVFRDLYNDPKMSWVKDQVNETINDASYFLD